MPQPIHRCCQRSLSALLPASPSRCCLGSCPVAHCICITASIRMLLLRNAAHSVMAPWCCPRPRLRIARCWPARQREPDNRCALARARAAGRRPKPGNAVGPCRCGELRRNRPPRRAPWRQRLPVPMPRGAVAASHRAPGAPIVIETTRNGAGTLALRGRMVPAQGFPPGAEHGHAPRIQPTDAGYIDTGFACRIGHDARTLTVTAPPPA